MKEIIPVVLLIFTLPFILLSYSPATWAKKHCKPFQKKLHNVQAMQRKSYSLKRGINLREKEDLARNKWWQCERLSKKRFNAKYGIKGKKSKKSKNRKTVAKKRKNKLSVKKIKVANYSETTTFNQQSAIIIRSKYQGEKQSAWLEFYNLPAKCKKPKTMSDFAYCHEHKRQQQTEFDEVYQE
ncbi:hypothetical protein [Colwellia sp. E2M01]|uniref:hypothetical protein n=1 Tax=Colwellia sp. E2M01 TaxID=2841561 RepID=UPI001C090714|nr:hypothetical protein [Colwellia sp. E2M01]MBU2870176.1 hypothetical protein [Colwellia sp. E2M01]